jgi:DNA-binding MarR family transcriptional regulator
LILYVVYLKGEISQIDLAENTLKDAPAITRIVDHLILKNYLLKNTNADDRRSFKVSLTEEGKELVKYLLPHLVEFREKGWQGLTEEDYQTLRRLLNKVFHNY